jgi:hypothetical protein
MCQNPVECEMAPHVLWFVKETERLQSNNQSDD